MSAMSQPHCAIPGCLATSREVSKNLGHHTPRQPPSPRGGMWSQSEESLGCGSSPEHCFLPQGSECLKGHGVGVGCGLAGTRKGLSKRKKKQGALTCPIWS